MASAAYKRDWDARNREKVRGYCRSHYSRNRDKMLARSKARREATQHVREWLDAMKAALGCADCGERDPIVLDFDHKDRKQKRFGIAYLRGLGNMAKLCDEIAKCDVRCANCHRRKTWKETH